MPSGQRGAVKIEGEPLPLVNIVMQVHLLSQMVVGGGGGGCRKNFDGRIKAARSRWRICHELFMIKR